MQRRCDAYGVSDAYGGKLRSSKSLMVSSTRSHLLYPNSLDESACSLT
ncbi:hypothetical protein [Nostoc sp.]